jgi:flavin-dependent dehydrogenase
VGIGTYGKFNYNLKEILEEFKQKNNIKGKVNYVTGGLIPLGLQRPLIYKNILFVGDAGVGTMPLSGQGIYRALLSGDIAGKCIAKGAIEKYPYKIAQAFIKWDIIGKIFMHTNYRFRKINPDLVLASIRSLTKFVEITHIL